MSGGGGDGPPPPGEEKGPGKPPKKKKVEWGEVAVCSNKSCSYLYQLNSLILKKKKHLPNKCAGAWLMPRPVGRRNQASASSTTSIRCIGLSCPSLHR